MEKLDICGYCLAWIANARLPPPDAGWSPDRISVMWPGHTLYPAGDTSDPGTFSCHSCDACMRQAPGLRYPAVAIPSTVWIP